MKRFLLVPALVLLLASCDNKDKEEVVLNEKTNVKQELQGDWSNSFQTTNYYNDAGQVAHKDTSTTDVRFHFEGSKMEISHPGVSGKETLTFALPDTSATDYVVISKNGQMQDYWKITAKNDTAMVWEKFLDYAGYRDANGNMVTSRRGVYTYAFKKL
ncbi:hypothetical protein MKJ04_00645 [Pontibacter sp. E15-1]|uniref:hypothetical protein n=1 Tax=Pontibacter sp. E15-1 TaxID=2919918 RepID=UPI001F501CB6|nr:hypothetical protein [Pontibacter sp. E15-1]MCJ8163330.1 hypothetical protein [Pontibacter sp. E15-1]